tara:strand:- start:7630 stop:7899 length:270 start_codon:yes stop_codon:yes gene_type:complete
LAKEVKSEELTKGFQRLEKNYFWQTYRSRLEAEYERVELALISNASAEADQLRVCASLMSAFRTALELPERMIQEAQTQEEIERFENDG